MNMDFNNTWTRVAIASAVWVICGVAILFGADKNMHSATQVIDPTRTDNVADIKTAWEEDDLSSSLVFLCVVVTVALLWSRRREAEPKAIAAMTVAIALSTAFVAMGSYGADSIGSPIIAILMAIWLWWGRTGIEGTPINAAVAGLWVGSLLPCFANIEAVGLLVFTLGATIYLCKRKGKLNVVN